MVLSRQLTERDPVGLLNVRLGVDHKSRPATVWAKNLTDNADFKALPRRWGVDLNYRF